MTDPSACWPTAPLLRLWAVSLCELYHATLIGNPPPALRALRADMTTVGVGDFVMEWSTYGEGRQDADRFGTVLRIETHPRAGQVVWLHTPDDREVRWHSAAFLRLPHALRQVRMGQGGSALLALFSS